MGTIFSDILYFSHFTRFCKISGTKHVSGVDHVAAILWAKYKVHVILFPTIKFCDFSLVLSEACRHCPAWLFASDTWWSAFKACCSDIISMSFRWFHFPFLSPVLVSFLVTSHSYYVLIVRPFILKNFRLLPAPYFYILYCNVF